MSSLQDTTPIGTVEGFNPAEIDAFLLEVQKLVDSSNSLINSVNNPTEPTTAVPTPIATAGIASLSEGQKKVGKALIGAGVVWALYEVFSGKHDVDKKKK